MESFSFIDPSFMVALAFVGAFILLGRKGYSHLSSALSSHKQEVKNRFQHSQELLEKAQLFLEEAIAESNKFQKHAQLAEEEYQSLIQGIHRDMQNQKKAYETGKHVVFQNQTAVLTQQYRQKCILNFMNSLKHTCRKQGFTEQEVGHFTQKTLLNIKKSSL
ncbi:MAG: hypothetical protein BGO07_03230 [Alphaproteobacteria bacterium 40-19]|nr:MAG: hypothetical protein BGO07_03230 [Alphaproteobacteria bacterium 40-19]